MSVRAGEPDSARDERVLDRSTPGPAPSLLGPTPRHRAMLFMLAFGALWAIVEMLAGDLLSRYSPYQVVFTRYAVHITFMVLVWGVRAPSSLWRTRRPGYQFARSLLMVGMPASFVLSVQHGVDMPTVMAILWLSPLVVLGLSAIVLGERARAPTWIATLVAAAGTVLLIGLGRAPSPALLVFPIAMTLTFSTYVVMTRSLRTETTRANLFYTAFGVALVLSPFIPHVWITPTLHDFLVMVGVGVLGFGCLAALDLATTLAPVGDTVQFAYAQWPTLIAGQCLLGGGHVGKRAFVGTGLVVLAGLYTWTRSEGRGARLVTQP